MLSAAKLQQLPAAPVRCRQVAPVLLQRQAAVGSVCTLPGHQQRQQKFPSLRTARSHILYSRHLVGRRHQQHQAAAGAVAPVAPAAAAAASAFWPALVQAWNINPASVMLAAGACILGISLSIFLLAAIPTMLALRGSARAMESLLQTVESEVPDTAATLRLSGLELADCIQEVGALSTDLTDGVRASARALASAEQGLRQGASMAGKAVTDHVLPQARDKVEAALQKRAKLDYTGAVMREAMQTTKTTAQRLRFVLAASGLARGVATSARYLTRPGWDAAGGSFPEGA